MLSDITEDTNIVWVPQPGSQPIYLGCPIFEAMLEGTRGPGKTDTLLMDFLQHVGVGWGPEWKGILFRQSYPQLSDVISKTQKWFKRIFPSADYNQVKTTWTFPDGEQLLLRHMKDPDTYWNYHGHAYPWIGWEELTNWADDKCYKVMMSCCRSTVGPDLKDKFGRMMPRKYRSTTNPYGRGHNWVKKRWKLPQMRGIVLRNEVGLDGSLEPPRIAIHGHISENKILLEADPDYIQRIRASASNPAQAEAWLEGSWDITSGGMFDDLWDPRTHIVDAFKIPKTWKITRSFDWGSSRPFSVGWWARSDGSDVILLDGRKRRTVRGDLFRINEWYGTNGQANEGIKLSSQGIAKGIIVREIQMGLRTKAGIVTRVKPGAADSAIWNDGDGGGAPSIAKKMAQVQDVNGIKMPGVTFVRADKRPGSRHIGWQSIRDMLEDAIPPKNGVREKPGLFIFRNCESWIEHVPPLPRDEKDPDDVDTDTEDHIGDETRYEVMTTNRTSRSGQTVGTY